MICPLPPHHLPQCTSRPISSPTFSGCMMWKKIRSGAHQLCDRWSQQRGWSPFRTHVVAHANSRGIGTQPFRTFPMAAGVSAACYWQYLRSTLPVDS